MGPRSHGREPDAATPKVRRRVVLWGCLIGLAALAVVFFRPHRDRWPSRLVSGSAADFNVLLITLDTTRADRLGCYGYGSAATPHLDALAAGGIRFDDAVTLVPITLPAHSTILTGLEPARHGVRNNGEFELDEGHTTLAEVLQGEGYQTGAFVSAFVLDARFGLDQGFDTYDDNVDLDSANRAGLINRIHERPADRVTDAAVNWLQAKDRNRPFFCWVHYFDPHAPYKPPPPFDGRFRGRPYDGEIAFMDAQIGRLMQALAAQGRRESTLVIVVGDHGESLGEHGEATHTKLIYDSVMRVPLILACPGLFRGRYVVDDVVVSVADVVPTVLDLLGVAYPGAFDGASLVASHEDRDRLVFTETLAPYLDHGWSPLHGVRRHEDKFILAPRPEYYDLETDPKELNNLYPAVTGSSRASRDMLARALDERMAGRPAAQAIAEAAQPLDPEALTKLESLGYVGSTTEPRADGPLPDPKDMMPVARAVDQAEALAEGGRTAEALTTLRQAEKLAPHDQKVMLLIGKLQYALGLAEEAERSLLAAIEAHPTARIFTAAAQMMLGAQRPAAAAQVLERLRQREPDNVDALANLGIAYIQLGRLETAHERLLRAFELDGSRLETNLNLAECYRRLGRPHDALEHAQQAAEASPRTVQPHILRGLLLKELGRYEDAVEALSAGEDLAPRNPSIQQELANVFARLGDHANAAVHFHRLADLLPARWEPQLGLARSYLQSGQVDAAAEAIRRGLSLAPNQPQLLALSRRLDGP